MTYYEYFDCFFKILHLLHNILRLHRISATPKLCDASPMSFQDQIFAEIENSPTAATHTFAIEPVLIALYNTDMILPLTTLTVSPTQAGLVPCKYSLPKLVELPKTSAAFFCPVLFQALDLDAFYDVLCSIYLEHCVVFVSENLNVLTSAMYFLCTFCCRISFIQIS